MNRGSFCLYPFSSHYPFSLSFGPGAEGYCKNALSFGPGAEGYHKIAASFYLWSKEVAVLLEIPCILLPLVEGSGTFL